MSDGEQTLSDPSEADRRFRRTQKSLNEAFSGLFHARRYDQIRVGDIVEDAGVGRSTFYEHYKSKDDLLVQSMGGMLDIMASAAAPEEELPGLEHVVQHFWDVRDVGRYLLAGPPARDVLPRITRDLAKRIEMHVNARRAGLGREPILPARLVALQVAEAQFALVRAWLASDGSCTPAEIALGLRRTTQGAIAAVFADPG